MRPLIRRFRYPVSIRSERFFVDFYFFRSGNIPAQILHNSTLANPARTREHRLHMSRDAIERAALQLQRHVCFRWKRACGRGRAFSVENPKRG